MTAPLKQSYFSLTAITILTTVNENTQCLCTVQQIQSTN